MAIPGVSVHWPVPAEGRTVVLADGARAVVRTLAGGDVAVVQEVFAGMSERSRYQRYIGPKPLLSRRDVEQLTAVDHDNHEALVAIDPATRRAIGEAHLVRDETDRAIGEVAFAISDAWQNRRLGSWLAELLATRARQLGIRRIRATMLADNVRSRAIVRRMGRVVRSTYVGSAVELEVTLD
jgi:RimJ/RimL family protein N-acetyltransferase